MHGSQIIVLADGVRDMLATPTKANFSTACSDGTFMYVGDAPTAHTLNSHSDTAATGAELEILTDGSNADSKHRHAELSTAIQKLTWEDPWISTDNALGIILRVSDGMATAGVTLAEAVLQSPDTTDRVAVADGSVTVATNNVTRLDATDSGVQLGAANARVTTIHDAADGDGTSDTILVTQNWVKTHAGGTGDGDALVANPLSQFASTTSAQLAGVLSDESGTGVFLLGTNPAITTPTITGDIVFTERADHASTPGAGFGYLWTKNTTPSTLIFTDDAGTDTTLGSGGGVDTSGTPVANDYARFTDADTIEGRSYAEVKSDLAITEADITDLGGTVAMVADNLSVFASTTSAQLAGVLSDETGSGAAVFATSPTLVTPALGTPSSGNLTTCTGYEGTAVKSTGEVGGTKYLREDGDGTCSWQAIAGGGNVNNTGTPANNQIAVWTDATTIEGTSGLTYDGAGLDITGTLTTTGDTYIANSAVVYSRNNADSSWIQILQVFTDDALYVGRENAKLYLRTDSAVQVTIDNDTVDLSDCALTTTGTATSRGGRSLTESIKTGSFTAADGYDYLIYLDTAAADVTVTFPTGATGARFRCTVVGDDLANGYAVKFSLGSEKINSGTDDDPWWLFIEGDSVEYIYRNAIIGWVPIANIQPHRAMMSRDSAQSISNATFTQIAFDAEAYDVGGIADYTTNDRVDIRRDGEYCIQAVLTMPNLDTGERVYAIVDIDGTRTVDGVGYSSTTNRGVSACVSVTLHLNAGQYVEFYVYHDEDATQSTQTGVSQKPIMTVHEVR